VWNLADTIPAVNTMPDPGCYLYIDTDRIAPGQLKGVFYIFQRGDNSIDLFLDPEWRTFWTNQGFGLVLVNHQLDGSPNVDGGTISAASTNLGTTFNGVTYTTGNYFYQLLNELAEVAGYSEMRTCAIVWWGHSQTSGISTDMAYYVPSAQVSVGGVSRTLAYYNYHGSDVTSRAGNYTGNFQTTPGLYTVGRLDFTIRPWTTGSTASAPAPAGAAASALVAARAGAPISAVVDTDTPHGGGFLEPKGGGYSNVNAIPNWARYKPHPMAPHHFDHRGGEETNYSNNPFNFNINNRDPAPAERTGFWLYPFYGRQHLVFAWMHEIIRRRLPVGGTFHPVDHPFRSLDLAQGWLMKFPRHLAMGTNGSSPNITPPFEAHETDYDIKPYDEQSFGPDSALPANWTWFPTRELAEMARFYSSGGQKDDFGTPNSNTGVQIAALTPQLTQPPALGTDPLEAPRAVIRLTRPGLYDAAPVEGLNGFAWLFDRSLNQPDDTLPFTSTGTLAFNTTNSPVNTLVSSLYSRNFSNTRQAVRVEIAQGPGHAVLGQDFIIEETPFASLNLQGIEHATFGDDAQLSGIDGNFAHFVSTNRIPRWCIPPGHVLFSDRMNVTYLHVRGTNPRQVGDRQIVLRIVEGAGYSLGAVTQTKITLKGSLAPAADEDGDGLANLVEYAVGRDPVTTDSSTAPLVSNHSGTLALTFQRLRADLNYTVQASDDLAAWSDLATNPGTIGETITVQDSAALAATGARYLRLRVATE
jgi:hypothetical protein